MVPFSLYEFDPLTFMFLPHGDWVCIAFELGIQVKLLNIHVYFGKKGFGL